MDFSAFVLYIAAQMYNDIIWQVATIHDKSSLHECYTYDYYIELQYIQYFNQDLVL